MSAKKGTLVYDTQDICEMFGVDSSRIPYHIENGTIPAPIQGVGFRGQRKWSKAVVDKLLGLEQPKLDAELIREIVAQEIRKLVAVS